MVFKAHPNTAFHQRITVHPLHPGMSPTACPGGLAMYASIQQQSAIRFQSRVLPFSYRLQTNAKKMFRQSNVAGGFNQRYPGFDEANVRLVLHLPQEERRLNGRSPNNERQLFLQCLSHLCIVQHFLIWKTGCNCINCSCNGLGISHVSCMYISISNDHHRVRYRYPSVAVNPTMVMVNK